MAVTSTQQKEQKKVKITINVAILTAAVIEMDS